MIRVNIKSSKLLQCAPEVRIRVEFYPDTTLQQNLVRTDLNIGSKLTFSLVITKKALIGLYSSMIVDNLLS